MSAIHLKKQDFINKVADIDNHPTEWIFQGERPCIVDFFATWCGPCKMLSPVLDEIADEYAGKIDVYKVDVDEEFEIASAFNIRSVPSLLFVPMQGNPQMAAGALPKAELKKAIESVLLK